MTTIDNSSVLGVDVAKATLDVWCAGDVVTVDNTQPAILEFLENLSEPCRIAVEPTSRYHCIFVQLAQAAGHTLYLVDPYRVSRYRDAVGERVKNDRKDAYLLARYLQAEQTQLTPYRAVPIEIKQLKELMRARMKLVTTHVALKESLAGVPGFKKTGDAVLARLKRAVEVIDRRLARLVESSGYATDYHHCQSIPGVGMLNAIGLVSTYYRGRFTRADAYIAFMGLDVRVRESGTYKGQRKLTKRGDPEMRRLLFNAARAASRTRAWKPYYESLTARGLSSTQASVALSRKIARVAFALIRDNSEFKLAGQ